MNIKGGYNNGQRNEMAYRKAIEFNAERKKSGVSQMTK
jgi:hypothetical protein